MSCNLMPYVSIIPPAPAELFVPAIFNPATVDVPVVLTDVLVNVKLDKLPVAAAATAKDESANVRIFPVVVVEVIDVVPNPVSAIDPDVPVKLNAPVESVKPLEAV